MSSRGRHKGLSRERIATAALAFIDEHGLDALSTRRLGRELGVAGMALYKHFKSREQILTAVTDRLMTELVVPARGRWQDRVRTFARHYRALARIHPHSFVLLATRRATGPGAMATVDALFRALLDEGFSPSDAALVFRTVGNFCQGTALDELAVLRELSAPSSATRPLRDMDAFIHPARFDEHFERGLDFILEGVTRHHAPARRPGKRRRVSDHS